jgi:predicted nucleic acid-binding Zn ribbon protein
MQPLSAALDEVLAALAPPTARRRTDSSARTIGGVFARWEDAVGPTVAAHARPVKLAEGRLLVDVDEPGWASQLRYLEADLLARIREVAGPGVDAIDWRVRRR